MRTSQVRGIVGGASLLVLGAVIGVTADRILSARGAPPDLTATSVEGIHMKTLAHLQQELALDQSQVEQIHEVVARHQGRVDSSWLEIRPNLISAIDSVHAHIALILRPEQLAGFHKWLSTQGAAELHVDQHQREHRSPGPEH